MSADVLIQRLVERAATADDLRDLAARAGADDRVWESAAAALRAESALERAVGAAVAAADRVEITPLPRRRAPWRLAAALSGWATAAAALALASVGALDPAPESRERVAELPRILLEAKPAPADSGGGFEILFVRPVVERAIVPDLFEFGTDEHGELAVTPAAVTRLRAPESL